MLYGDSLGTLILPSRAAGLAEVGWCREMLGCSKVDEPRRHFTGDYGSRIVLLSVGLQPASVLQTSLYGVQRREEASFHPVDAKSLKQAVLEAEIEVRCLRDLLPPVPLVGLSHPGTKGVP